MDRHRAEVVRIRAAEIRRLNQGRERRVEPRHEPVEASEGGRLRAALDAGEIRRLRLPRRVDLARSRVDRHRDDAVLVDAAEVRGPVQPRQRRVEARDESVGVSVEFGLRAAGGAGEIRGRRHAADVDLPGSRMDGDRQDLVAAASAEIGHLKEIRERRIESRNEGVGVAETLRTGAARGAWQVSRERGARDEDLAGRGKDRDRVDTIGFAATDVGRLEDRIDDDGLRLVVAAQAESVGRSADEIGHGDRPPDPALLLKRLGRREGEPLRTHPNDEAAVCPEGHGRRAGQVHANRRDASTRRQREDLFDGVACRAERHSHPRPNFAELHFVRGRGVGSPSRGIGSAKVAHSRRGDFSQPGPGVTSDEALRQRPVLASINEPAVPEDRRPAEERRRHEGHALGPAAALDEPVPDPRKPQGRRRHQQQRRCESQAPRGLPRHPRRHELQRYNSRQRSLQIRVRKSSGFVREAWLRIRFADCTLDFDTREVSRGGEPVHLEPKAYRLLELLLEARPKALPKDQLQDALWPKTFVSERSLARLVEVLRSNLGDSAKEPHLIRTVHGFGYAFCGEASLLTSGKPAQSSSDLHCRVLWGDREISLHPGENIIGRDPDATVWIDLSSVSRRHARILVGDSEATIEDLGSRNGTSVGGEHISKPRALANGDKIKVGAASLLFQAAFTGSDRRRPRRRRSDATSALSPTRRLKSPAFVPDSFRFSFGPRLPRAARILSPRLTAHLDAGRRIPRRRIVNTCVGFCRSW